MKLINTFLLSFLPNKLNLLFRSKNLLLTLVIAVSISCETDLDNNKSDITFEKMICTTPRVLVNGVPLKFERTQPEERDDVIMVPVGNVLNRLGYTFDYNSWTRTLIYTKESNKIELRAGKLEAKINGEKIILLTKPYIKRRMLMVESNFFSNLETILSDYDEETKSLQLYYYDELDYGIYFFDKQLDTNEPDTVGCQKFVSGEQNLFYDPSKPTVIWVHGWQNGAVKNKARKSFYLQNEDIERYVHNEWVEKGWNVAIFSWFALADELLPYNAESKINSATTDGVGMRWKKADGSYVTDNTSTESVAELFAKAYEELAALQIHPTIRLAGSSFGGQVVLHGAEIIQKKDISPLPSRIALLDMAWTHNYVESQGLNTNKITARAAKALSPEILIEYYRSSALSTPFTPKELMIASAFQEMIFSYAGIELKHTAITEHYFWSFEYAAPVAFDQADTSVGVGLSASTDDDAVREMMGTRYNWKHKDGRDTFNPGDDTFERERGPR